MTPGPPPAQQPVPAPGHITEPEEKHWSAEEEDPFANIDKSDPFAEE